MSVCVRPYTKDLEDEVIEMILWSQNVEFGVVMTIEQQPDLRDVAGSYQRGAGNFWVAAHDGRVVGCIALVDLGGGDGALRKMFVRPEHRGSKRGTAAALLEALLCWCRGEGIRTLYLSTIDVLRAARRFYEKNGFVAVPREALPAAFSAMAVDTTFYRRDVGG